MSEELPNYYDVLGVARNATTAEIRTAYRRLARITHPDTIDRNSVVDSLNDNNNNSRSSEGQQEHDNSSYRLFCEINEAYEVLSNPQKRHEYDSATSVQSSNIGGMGADRVERHRTEGFGAFGPFSSFPSPSFPTYSYYEPYNPTGVNPFSNINISHNDFPFSSVFHSQQQTQRNVRHRSGMRQSNNHTQPPAPSVPVGTEKRSLKVDLEILYNAPCTCTFTISRRLIDGETGKPTEPLEHVIDLNVDPSWRDGSVISVPGVGDENEAGEYNDIEFTIEVSPHSHYSIADPDSGCGSNLIHRKLISLEEALLGVNFSLETLDGRMINIDCTNEVITPSKVKIIDNEGLRQSSNTSENNRRGDLLIFFDVAFPTRLSLEQKELFHQAFMSLLNQ